MILKIYKISKARGCPSKKCIIRFESYGKAIGRILMVVSPVFTSKSFYALTPTRSGSGCGSIHEMTNRKEKNTNKTKPSIKLKNGTCTPTTLIIIVIGNSSICCLY